MKKISLLIILSFFASGCSILNPYDNESNCRMNEDHGKCASVEKAYEASLSGKKDSPAPPQSDDRDKDSDESTEPSIPADSLGEYQDAYLKRLKSLIEEPETPMVKPEKTIRAYIMPYGTKKLYTGRHVYVMVEEPTFILGDYLATPKKDHKASLINPIKP